MSSIQTSGVNEAMDLVSAPAERRLRRARIADMHYSARAAIFALFCLALAATAARPAAAQQDDGFFTEGGVEIEVDQFGVGNFSRAGDYAGVRLALRDDADRVRAAVVRLHLQDVDGDTVYIQREVTLNPGRRQFVWLYPLLPFSTTSGSIFPVTVHERTGEGGQTAIGRQIGATRIAPRNMPRESVGLIGIFGRQDMGLSLYGVTPLDAEQPGTAHERSEIISDLDPTAMPDQWLGLAAYDALVWVDGQPGDLTGGAPDALRAWVQRGGHLIVAIPPAGQTWTNPRNNPIHDLMPRAELSRQEGVDYERYRALITDRETPLPDEGVVHTFTPRDDAERSEAVPILRGPDGRTVVVRRLIGAGMVTLVGLDLADRRLASRIDPQTFWHRVLGRRFDVYSRAEMDELRQTASVVNFSNQRAIWLDDPIGAEINMTGRAGAGLLLALVVFGAYLVLQGPLGFGLLKMRTWQRHAWVLFLGIAALFTFVAWGGANMLRPSEVEGRHVTFIDHVYGQDVDRTRSWFSVLLPTYGESVVQLGPVDAPSVGTDQPSALSVWDNPVNRMQRTFPDTRSYSISMEQPDRLRVPTRSTVKQFRADWAGGPPWPMPQPVGGEIRFESQGGLAGAVTHDLPAALEKVQNVLVRRQKPLQEFQGDGPLLFEVLAWARSDSWAPEETLDLSSLEAPSLGDAWLEDLAGHASRFADARIGESTGDLQSAPRRFSMITWAPMLDPPDYRSYRRDKLLLQRRSTHGLDLGKWFTQPCLIIVGQISDGPSPTPLIVDGEQVETRGRTVVRWIYPLAPDAPSAQQGNGGRF